MGIEVRQNCKKIIRLNLNMSTLVNYYYSLEYRVLWPYVRENTQKKRNIAAVCGACVVPISSNRESIAQLIASSVPPESST